MGRSLPHCHLSLHSLLALVPCTLPQLYVQLQSGQSQYLLTITRRFLPIPTQEGFLRPLPQEEYHDHRLHAQDLDQDSIHAQAD